MPDDEVTATGVASRGREARLRPMGLHVPVVFSSGGDGVRGELDLDLDLGDEARVDVVFP